MTDYEHETHTGGRAQERPPTTQTGWDGDPAHLDAYGRDYGYVTDAPNVPTSPAGNRTETPGAPAPRSESGASRDALNRPITLLKVSAHSRPSAAAGAVAGIIRGGGVAEIQSIGAGATNQAIKAVAIARSYLREEGVELICIPSFTDLMIGGEERTAIRLLVEPRPAR